MATKTPVFFISHGGPNLLENQEKPGDFYSWLGNYIKHELKPKAIVIISAHWQGQGPNGVLVDVSEKPDLIYDFYNFPKRYYEETWDHRGSPALAKQVIDLLQKADINATGERYGNDHGVWVPLKRAMRHNPNIPIIEVSTFGHEDLALHTKLGQALAPLRDENVLIIGSGSAVHNLPQMGQYINQPTPTFVSEFDNALTNITVGSKGQERVQLANNLDKNKYYRNAHPDAFHLVPYHVAVGAAGESQGKQLLQDYFSSLSFTSFAFGLPENTTLPKYDGTQQRDEL